MPDLKLFKITNGAAAEITGSSFALEKSLQTIVEQNMETLFAVRFLASEYVTGSRQQSGRIDSLGLDENGCPVIFEYKRASNENVINQGLFYLDWLLDHKANFELLVQKTLGREASENIDWSSPRLVCVANEFNRYDAHAIGQINRSIELIKYQDFEGDLLAFELIASTGAAPISDSRAGKTAGTKSKATQKTAKELLEQSPSELKKLFDEIAVECEALGDDVTRKELKYYFAFRRLKNFACVEIHPQSGNLLIYLKVDPDTVVLEEDFSRDVRNVGHFGTGDLELRVKNAEDLQKAIPLLQKSYEAG